MNSRVSPLLNPAFITSYFNIHLICAYDQPSKHTINASTRPTTRHLVPGSLSLILTIPPTELRSSSPPPPPPRSPTRPLQSTLTCTYTLHSARTRLCSSSKATAPPVCCVSASSTTKCSQRVCVPTFSRPTTAASATRPACRARWALPPTCWRSGTGYAHTGHHLRMCSLWAIALAQVRQCSSPARYRRWSWSTESSQCSAITFMVDGPPDSREPFITHGPTNIGRLPKFFQSSWATQCQFG